LTLAVSIVYLSRKVSLTRLKIFDMSKKKKTLKQKIVADLRHAQYRFETADSLDEVVELSPTKEVPEAYAFLHTDLRKTTSISLLIVTSQIILYFLLKSRVLDLPFISY